MAVSDNSKITGKSGKRRLISLAGGAVAAIAVILLAMVFIVKLWIGPFVLETQFSKAILSFWDGTVDIQNVRFSYNGGMRFKGLTLHDSSGKQWLSVPEADLVIKKWWSSEPVVAQMTFRKPDFKAYVPVETSKRLPLPLKSTSSDSGQKRVSIEKFTIEQGRLFLVYGSKQSTVYDTVDLSLAREGTSYRILAKGDKKTNSAALEVSGSIQADTFDASLNITLKQALGEPECAFILRLFDISNMDTSGHIASELTVAGSLRELTSLRLQGKAEIKNCSIKRHIDPNQSLPALVQDLAGTIVFQGDRFSCESFTSAFCEGRANGTITGNISQAEGIALNGTFVVSDVNMAKFTAALPAKKQMTGKGIFEFNFGIVGRGLKGLNGRGFIFLDDADMRVVPLITKLLTFTGLKNFDPVKMSDTTCVFGIQDGVVTIERARVANRLVAIVAEPGSTVNLDTGIVDGHVMVVPLDRLQEIIKKVPGVNLLVNLKDRLTRLRIKGHWSDPPGKLITKEPLTDIREAAFGFFKDVAETGGQINGKMRDASKSLLKK